MRSSRPKQFSLPALLLLLIAVGVGCDLPDASTPVVGPAAATLAGPVDGASLGLGPEEQARLALLVEQERERVRQVAEASGDLLLALEKEAVELQDSPLLACSPLAYAAEVKIIGPRGGELQVGPHSLRIPAGALTEHVVITAELPASSLVSVQLSPHGLRFAKQPTLALSYKHCLRPLDLVETMVYVDDQLKILERPTSRDAGTEQAVVGRIDHFSRYAVATN